ncbi:transglycosylase SLT domain-containing protein [Sansalvadorimonas verongulae]|uniref:transglycosylase SLT domain-containing protein n=1 Tax=Sansalvadorimonas verongulae TaxID=2172824 RepID=UPI001E46F826|nr:transglycosylase SLT domain-containing protein [Sansalvadorimonas verongulae]
MAALRSLLLAVLLLAVTVVLLQPRTPTMLLRTPLFSECPHLSVESRHLTLLEWEYFLSSSLEESKAKEVNVYPATELSAGEAASLDNHIHRRLPRYQDLFRIVASEYRIDWHLVAAISYQESHWYPKAKSPTGVRGMMMLTLPTAKEMGIRNRLDAEQSVRGGVRYLEQLKGRLPESIQEPDRTWQALAAYNVGIGHLYDARTLARSHGLNPDLWTNLSDFLLKLEDPQWHNQTRYGYARGAESVQYVENIQRYYRHILARQPRKPLPVMAQSEGNRSTL